MPLGSGTSSGAVLWVWRAAVGGPSRWAVMGREKEMQPTGPSYGAQAMGVLQHRVAGIGVPCKGQPCPPQ